MKVVRIVGVDYSIYLALFDNEYQMGMSFLRMQECYESHNPAFHQSIFFTEDFMEWYASTNGEGKFSYPNDFEGYNVPGNIVDFFIEKFPNHSKLELQLIDELAFARKRYRDTDKNYYLIGALTGDKSTIRHELRHGLFYNDPIYRKRVQKIVRKYPCKNWRKDLRKTYSEGVLEDEMNAFATTGWRTREEIITKEMLTLRQELRTMEKEYGIPYKVKLDMRVVIAGSRTVTKFLHVKRAVDESGFDISEVVSGTARGVDRLGELWAFQNGGVPVKRFPAKWDLYGKAAGHIRNDEMAAYADAVIVVWDGKSKGSKNMIECAKRRGCLVYEKVVKVS